MSLSLLLHEMATNAAKYGALSAPGGQIAVKWSLEDENTKLRLSWTESGGPPVSPPTSTGYGTRLITSTATYSLNGQLSQEFPPSGYRAEIAIPLRGDVTQENGLS